MSKNSLTSILNKKMLLRGFLFVLFSFLYFTDTVYSASNFSYLKNWQPVVTVGGGVAFTSDVGKSTTFPIQNPSTDEFFIYQPHNQDAQKGMFDLFLGAERPLHTPWALQLGIDYNQLAPFYPEGILIQGADVASENQYAYSYKIRTTQLLAEGKLFYNFKQVYHPYFLVGLGASFNRASNFATDVPPFLTFTREYENHSRTSFTYALGLGLDIDAAQHCRLGLGYRFADLGKAGLGQATIDTTQVPWTLSQSHFYVNEVVAQFTYLF